MIPQNYDSIYDTFINVLRIYSFYQLGSLSQFIFYTFLIYKSLHIGYVKSILHINWMMSSLFLLVYFYFVTWQYGSVSVADNQRFCFLLYGPMTFCTSWFRFCHQFIPFSSAAASVVQSDSVFNGWPETWICYYIILLDFIYLVITRHANNVWLTRSLEKDHRYLDKHTLKEL